MNMNTLFNKTKTSLLLLPPTDKSNVVCIDNDGTSKDDDDDNHKKTPSILDTDEAFAKQLQQEEWDSQQGQVDEDAKLAAILQQDDDDPERTMQADANLAATLARVEEVEMEERKKVERVAMHNSLDGRSWLFVNQVLDMHKQLSHKTPGLSTVAVDDICFLGKNFLQCVADFETKKWPSTVTLAYHYTKSERMDTIKQDGLMTMADRKLTYNNSNGKGVFGDGIYTGTNPLAFRGHAGGNVGLVVAVVLGNTQRVPYVQNPTARLKKNINTVIGNKKIPQLNGEPSELTKFTDELVLQTSKQCLPLLQFNTSLAENKAGEDAIWKYHQELQHLLDQFFNKGVRTALKTFRGSPVPRPPVAPPTTQARPAVAPAPTQARPTAPRRTVPVAQLVAPPRRRRRSIFSCLVPRVKSRPATTRAASSTPARPAATNQNITRRATTSPTLQVLPQVVTYTMPRHLMTGRIPHGTFVTQYPGSKEDCAICMEPLCNKSGHEVVSLSQCLHEYHKKCIKDSLKSFPKCPVCRALICKPQGKCPSGTMSIATNSTKCSGYESCGGSIVITYNMPDGKQMPYHDNPGQSFQGTKRTAYLPNNDEGKKLLNRLVFAWKQGLTFTIGTSLTTGQANCVTWTSIHHKTSQSGGTHGFPDAGFFVNCNSELDAAGVPKSAPL
jgi:deltex-like protein